MSFSGLMFIDALAFTAGGSILYLLITFINGYCVGKHVAGDIAWNQVENL
jgi:hypothetical protein